MGNACTNCNCAKEGDVSEILTYDNKNAYREIPTGEMKVYMSNLKAIVKI